MQEPPPGRATREVVAPSHDDPVVQALSPVIGGPRGAHGGRSWWTPLRVLMAMVCVTFALGMVQKAPCAADAWQNGTVRYTQMCYSDIPYLYSGRGFAEEARKMHYGEAEERSIYGEADLKEARALLEEGIDVLPIPVVPDDRN